MLVEALIAQICIGLSGQQLEACHKAFEAAGLQTHVTQDVNMVEDRVKNYATAKATSAAQYVGVEKEVGAVLFAAKVARDKKIEYKLIRNNGVVPEVTTGATLNGGSLQFNWRF